MNDFKVIKCKKCDAGLVEMSGQKLTHCVQCGHQFGQMTKNSQQRRPRTINGNSPQIIQQTEAASVSPNAAIQGQNKPDMQTLLRKLKALKNSAQGTQVQTKTKSETAKVLPKKKKGFPLGTIIFWIILFNVLRNIFKM